jgi:DNA topoisomerase-1
MTPTPDTLNDLYSDTKTCAKLIVLSYIDNEDTGFTRQKHGRGFTYRDVTNHKAVDKKMKAAIAKLVIPPAWQNVWICPDGKGHVLATGVDERGRKQYIYHPKWRTMRDLIKFYRMIVFGAALPKVRRDIDKHLRDKALSRERVIATMLWILDNTYIRIGNDVYFQENESIGLTTLTDKNLVIAGNVVTLSFKAKSGKNQQITFENKRVADTLAQLQGVRGARLFRYRTEQGWQPIDSSDINQYLHEKTATTITAKDFRTWGGTLMAFHYLIDGADGQKADKAVVAAVDHAAAILGNTRAVAKASYVHPHILDIYGKKNFARFYKQAKGKRRVTGLDQRENELLHFLEILFAEEFDLLKQTS